MEVKTERLVLKKITERDKADLVSLIGDWEVSKWLSRVPYPYSEKHAEEWISMVSKSSWNLNIFDSGRLCGGVGLTKLEDLRQFELGFWVSRNSWGKGIATEAAKGLIEATRESRKGTSIVASYIQGNASSANVLKKLNFKDTGSGQIFCISRQEKVDCINLCLKDC